MKPINFYGAVKLLRQYYSKIGPFGFLHRHPIDNCIKRVIVIPPNKFIPAECWDEYLAASDVEDKNQNAASI